MKMEIVTEFVNPLTKFELFLHRKLFFLIPDAIIFINVLGFIFNHYIFIGIRIGVIGYKFTCVMIFELELKAFLSSLITRGHIMNREVINVVNLGI